MTDGGLQQLMVQQPRNTEMERLTRQPCYPTRQQERHSEQQGRHMGSGVIVKLDERARSTKLAAGKDYSQASPYVTYRDRGRR